jgi:hypothetical protein
LERTLSWVSVLDVSAEGEAMPMLLNLNADNVMSSAISECECDIRTLGSGDSGLYLARSENETLAVSSLSNTGAERWDWRHRFLCGNIAACESRSDDRDMAWTLLLQSCLEDGEEIGVATSRVYDNEIGRRKHCADGHLQLYPALVKSLLYFLGLGVDTP